MSGQTIAIVGAKNEEETIANTLLQLRRADIQNVVLVCNGCTDHTVTEAKRAAQEGDTSLIIITYERPLGHDVARAIGTYCAMRHVKKGQYVYIDADWQGPYGPMLRDFVQYAQQVNAQVCSITCRDDLHESATKDGAQLWQKVLTQQSIIPAASAPFMLPMAVDSSVFERLSPMWLAEPGRWTALAILHQFRWSTYPNFHHALVGHKSRAITHGQAMSKRIAHDAQYAWALLTNRKPRVETDIAPLPSRNLSALREYASEFQVHL